jgi:hypothetical protein
MTRKITLALLCLLGAWEIFLGLLFGPLQVYAQEVPFSLAMGGKEWSAEQALSFRHSMAFFKHQWVVVAWAGVATLVLAVVLFCFTGPVVGRPYLNADDSTSDV